MKTKLEQYIEFLSGALSLEEAAAIDEELSRPDSESARVAEGVARCGREALDQGFYGLESETVPFSEAVDAAIVPQEPTEEEPVSLTGDRGETRRQLGLYLARDYSDLMDHLPLWMPTVVRSNPLGAYRALLERLLSPRFLRAAEPSEVAPTAALELAETIVGSLAEAAANLPFPLPLVAAILIKEGWRAAT